MIYSPRASLLLSVELCQTINSDEKSCSEISGRKAEHTKSDIVDTLGQS